MELPGRRVLAGASRGIGAALAGASRRQRRRRAVARSRGGSTSSPVRGATSRRRSPPARARSSSRRAARDRRSSSGSSSSAARGAGRGRDRRDGRVNVLAPSAHAPAPRMPSAAAGTSSVLVARRRVAFRARGLLDDGAVARSPRGSGRPARPPIGDRSSSWGRPTRSARGGQRLRPARADYATGYEHLASTRRSTLASRRSGRRNAASAAPRRHARAGARRASAPLAS